MNCTNCGTNLPDNAMFCSVCGSPVASQNPVQEQPVQAQPVYQQPTDQMMYQPPIQNQPVYQQPTDQAMYQPPIQNQPVYQQPTDQSLYQPPVQNQPIYQQPTDQTLYQTPVQNQPAYQQPVNQTMYGQPVAPKKKSKAPWIALGVSLFLLIIIVAIVVVLLVSCSGADKSSPDAVVNSFMEAIAEDEADDCLDTIYPCMLSSLTSQGFDEEAIYLMMKTDTLDSFSAASVSFSNLNITERVDVAPDEIALYNSTMASMDGYIPVTAGLDLSGTVTVAFNGTSIPSDLEWRATVVCADGEYYIIDFNLYE